MDGQPVPANAPDWMRELLARPETDRYVCCIFIAEPEAE